MILYTTRSREHNALSALERWKSHPDWTILTDGISYIVAEPGIDRLLGRWEITSPEEIESEFVSGASSKDEYYTEGQDEDGFFVIRREE